MRRYFTFQRRVVGLLLSALVFCANLGADESTVFARRRQMLMDAVQEGIILIPSQLKAGQNFEDNKDFIYLTGLQEPEAVLYLNPQGEPRQILFRRRTGNIPSDPGLEQNLLERMDLILKQLLKHV